VEDFDEGVDVLLEYFPEMARLLLWRMQCLHVNIC
jgi:hypothetical protein